MQGTIIILASIRQNFSNNYSEPQQKSKSYKNFNIKSKRPLIVREFIRFSSELPR